MFNHNFDESSAEWRKNKIKLENGYFKYKCKKENCNVCIYLYITENTNFYKFATDFDLKNKNNPNKHIYCENHLFTSFC